MSPQPVIHNTFVLERSYPVSIERVFNAFADPAIRRRWFAPGDHHDVEAFEQDFRPWGLDRVVYRMKETSPIPGAVITNNGVYLDVVPNRRIVAAHTMKMGDHCFSASLTTVELIETAEGTSLLFTHQGAFFEGADGPKMREAGWNALFDNLGRELGPGTE